MYYSEGYAYVVSHILTNSNFDIIKKRTFVSVSENMIYTPSLTRKSVSCKNSNQDAIKKGFSLIENNFSTQSVCQGSPSCEASKTIDHPCCRWGPLLQPWKNMRAN
jgi:hypothetical protein